MKNTCTEMFEGERLKRDRYRAQVQSSMKYWGQIREQIRAMLIYGHSLD